MKTTYIIPSLSLVLFSLVSSCSKDQCIECHYSDSGANKSSGEVCGTAKEIKSVRVNWEQQAEDDNSYANCSTWTK